MDAHVSLEALEKFKHILNRFSTGMSVEAQKMQLHLKKTHQQLEQKHYELRRQLQMCQDPISHERAKQQLMEFERLFAGFCQAAQECIKGFQQQELMTTNREKATVKIDQKVGVLREYLGSRLTGSGTDQANKVKADKLTKKQLATKPKNSPSPEKWELKGGSISIDKNGTWIYHDWEGNSVSYPNGFPDFKSAGMVKQEIQIDQFESYKKDFDRADDLAPNGPMNRIENTWHHHQDLTTMQEINKKLHRRFTHRGGFSEMRKNRS